MKNYLFLLLGFVVLWGVLFGENETTKSPAASNPIPIAGGINTDKNSEVFAQPGLDSDLVDQEKAQSFAAIPRDISLQINQISRSQENTDNKIAAFEYLYVKGSRVNVRDGPGVGHKKIGSLEKGAKVILRERGSGWFKISGNVSGRQMTGWMSARYLTNSIQSVDPTPASSQKRNVAPPSSAEINRARREIIRVSIASYPGSCPCPYNRDRAGSLCGKRSAWSKPGGYSPICYDSDITQARLSSYFARQR